MYLAMVVAWVATAWIIGKIEDRVIRWDDEKAKKEKADD